MPNKGQFMISLDFELYWGVRDIYPLSYYRDQMSGEREVIPRLLELFEANEIHATWAVVGLMFTETLEEMLGSIPDHKPEYKNKKLSPYPYINEGNVGNGEADDPYHFANTLIRGIQKTKYQQVSTHTFSHFYCREEGQTLEDFKNDLSAAVQIAEKKDYQIRSIVFPRNQIDESYIKVLQELGIQSYRGNPSHWLHAKGNSSSDSLIKRAFRLLDSYVNLSGHNCYSIENSPPDVPINLPATQFLRSYSRKLRLIEPLRLRRILRGMTHAAKHGLVYHLWWHPYNLAANREESMAFLNRIINHFIELKSKYGMVSTSMEELAETVMRGTQNSRQVTHASHAIKEENCELILATAVAGITSNMKSLRGS